MRRISVAIAGLGKVGSQFLEALLSVGSERVKVLAVAEKREESPSVQLAKEKGIAYFRDARDMLRSLEDTIDVLFDLTGDALVHSDPQDILASINNKRTVLVPEPVAFLIWSLITEGKQVYPR